MKDRLRSTDTIRHTFSGLKTLAEKVLEELCDFPQLLKAGRRKQLWDKGVTALNGSLSKKELDTGQIESVIEKRFVSYSNANFDFYYVDGNTFKFISYVFSNRVRYLYNPSIQLHAVYRDVRRTDYPILAELKKRSSVATIVMSTYIQIDQADQYQLLPALGWKSADGIKAPFMLSQPYDTLQHGGCYFSNTNGSVSLLNYDELLEATKQPIEVGGNLIQANWYMDSGNQTEVCARDNLQIRRLYNTIGLLYFKNKVPVVASLSTERSALKSAVADMALHLPGMTTSINERMCTMHEIAAFYNFISKKYGAVGWRVVGLEYNGGGTYTDSTILDPFDRDYLLVYAPGSQNSHYKQPERL